VSGPVVPLHLAADVTVAAGSALTAVHRHLDRCKLSANTVKAYKRQAAAYVAWLTGRSAHHGDAFADLVGAEGAVTAWRRHLITTRASPSKVNQALAAVTLMYEQTGLRIAVKRARIPRPGEPGALTPEEEGAVRRAARRRGPRDAAIIAVLLDAGARVEECARLDAGDFAITARTGEIRLHGKGDEVRFVPLSKRARDLISAWLDERGRHPGPDSAARSPSPASPKSCWPSAPTPASQACAPTAAATPSARASAKAGPTPPRSKPSLATPPSIPRPGTSAPDQRRTPPSSSGSSITD